MAETSTKLGRVSLVPRGSYDAAATYNRLDIVEYEGSSYLVLADGTAGVTPAAGPSYMLVAEKGDPGATGETGAAGGPGPSGTDGADGVGIQSIVRTSGDGSPGTTDTYTITLTDGTTSTFTVYNGANGAQGPAGADGTSFVISGRYDTLAELEAAHPTGSEGEAWAVGSAEDNDIYLWDVDTAAWTNIGSLQGPPGPAGQDGADGGPGPAGADGANGATFTPAVSETGVLSFTNDGGLPNPEPVNIKGPPGEDGAPGQDGAPGTDGKTAYQYAVDGGYTGTEEEFQALMGTGPWLPLTGGTLTGTVWGTDIRVENGSKRAMLGTDSASGYLLLRSSGVPERVNLSGGSSSGAYIKVPTSDAEPSEISTLILGGIKSPVRDHDAANKAYVDTHALTVASNAGAHNSIFRGKNLGNQVTAAQYAAIAAGTFDDLFIGDYWEIDWVSPVVKYRIAAFDYYLGTGGTALTTHHVVIVPDTNLDSQKMNDTNITTGGYVGSKMYTQNLATARTKVNAVFSGHVLTHQFYLSNAVTNGKVTGTATVNQDVVLMSERNVYGQTIMSSECADGSSGIGWHTYDRTQFQLFALAPEFIQKQRSTYWLRDVVNASNFTLVDSRGSAGCVDTSISVGVRPAFSIS